MCGLATFKFWNFFAPETPRKITDLTATPPARFWQTWGAGWGASKLYNAPYQWMLSTSEKRVNLKHRKTVTYLGVTIAECIYLRPHLIEFRTCLTKVFVETCDEIKIRCQQENYLLHICGAFSYVLRLNCFCCMICSRCRARNCSTVVSGWHCWWVLMYVGRF